MNNYILPKDFDFYEELNKTLNNNNQDFKNICLISNKVLDEEYTIELDCGHKFNYLDLLNDINEFKSNNSNYNTYKLYDYQIRCPYCRQIQNNILPYYPEVFKNKIRGVNHPTHYSMGKNTCTYIFKQCYRNMCSKHFKSNAKINYTSIQRNYETLNKITVPKLKIMCKELNIRNYSKLKKNDLINKLVNI